MSRPSLLAGLTLACLSLGAAAARAEDRLFTRVNLDRLFDAVQTQHVTFKKLELTAEILGRRLDALYVPDRAPNEPAHVFKCPTGSTTLVRFLLDPEDHRRLHAFAEDDIPKIIARIFSAPRGSGQRREAINELKNTIRRANAEERLAMERFAGALLAEYEPTEPDLARPVAHYRGFVESEVKESLKRPDLLKELLSGQPYAVGAEPVSTLMLKTIRPGEVGEFRVDGKEFKKAWIGKMLIIEQPTKKGPGWLNSTFPIEPFRPSIIGPPTVPRMPIAPLKVPMR